MPIKKDKASANPEASECAHCGVQEGNHGAILRKCVRCKVTSYCSKPCQTAHWKAGHKLQCVRPEERTPHAVGTDKPLMEDPGKRDECPICLDPLDKGSACTLPCTHTRGGARTLPGGAHAPILGPQNSAAAEDFFPVQPTTVAKYSRQIGPAPVA